VIIGRARPEAKAERLAKSLGLGREVGWTDGDLGSSGAAGDPVQARLMRHIRGVGGDPKTRDVLGRHLFGRGESRRFRNRDRGADLIFGFCESLLQERADVGRGTGFLEPGFNVGEGLGGESPHGEENSVREISGDVKSVSGKEIGIDVLGAGKVLNLKVTLGENLPPAAKASIVRFEQVGGEHKL
jgi:hypothetical protein